MPPTLWVSVEGKASRIWASPNLPLQSRGKPWEAHGKGAGRALKQRAWVCDLPINGPCTPLMGQMEGCPREKRKTCCVCQARVHTGHFCAQLSQLASKVRTILSDVETEAQGSWVTCRGGGCSAGRQGHWSLSQPPAVFTASRANESFAVAFAFVSPQRTSWSPRIIVLLQSLKKKRKNAGTQVKGALKLGAEVCVGESQTSPSVGLSPTPVAKGKSSASNGLPRPKIIVM